MADNNFKRRAGAAGQNAEQAAAHLITVLVDGRSLDVPAGCTAAAAIARAAQADGAGIGVTRRSVGGMLRAPLCGMGICQECRVGIDGRAHSLACQTLCLPGMRIDTARGAQCVR
jgi:predicted molibdopterin-dependent oxidoreductase YjgC